MKARKTFLTSVMSAGSCSSTWGSASHHEKGRRLDDVESVASLTVHLDTKSMTSVGSSRFIGHTDSETKAYQLNWKEECKLVNYKSRMNREQEYQRRKFQHHLHLFHARYSPLLGDMNNQEEDMGFKSIRRPKSNKTVIQITDASTGNPVRNDRNISKEDNSQCMCETCQKIRKIIGAYDKLPRISGSVSNSVSGSVSADAQFKFSDQQIRAFLDLLEKKYISDIRGNEKSTKISINDSKFLLPSLGVNLQRRVNDFCRAQQIFNRN